MGTDPGDTMRMRVPSYPLSGRTRTTLQQLQRRVIELEREFHQADRVLAGALSACDGPSQREIMAGYLEAVQELRVSLQRLEAFVLQRVGEVEPVAPPARLGTPGLADPVGG